MCPRLPLFKESFGLDPQAHNVITSDELTSNPLKYLNDELHVIGKLKPIADVSEEFIYLEPPDEGWMYNLGPDLRVQPNLGDRVRLSEMTGELLVYITGKIRLYKGYTHGDPENIFLANTVLQDVQSLPFVRELIQKLLELKEKILEEKYRRENRPPDWDLFF